MSIEPCCLKGFMWDGTPTGRVDELAGLPTYVAGSSSQAAILLITDLFGWTFPNLRLLADHFAQEVGATVYVPDFFDGEVISTDALLNDRWHEIDLEGFTQRNSREARETAIFAFARAMRTRHAKVGAIGYCYGGWVVFRLGAKEHEPSLVDCISAGHPSLLIKKDIDEAAVPVQILAPEFDQAYTAELKLHTFVTLQKRGVPFDYQHFHGVEHSCLVRGNDRKPGEREAMVRGKNAAVAWLRQFLVEP